MSSRDCVASLHLLNQLYTLNKSNLLCVLLCKRIHVPLNLKSLNSAVFGAEIIPVPSNQGIEISIGRN